MLLKIIIYIMKFNAYNNIDKFTNLNLFEFVCICLNLFVFV